jgi:tetratricopeptide (TPR) repeat protein
MDENAQNDATYQDQFGNTHTVEKDDELDSSICVVCRLYEKDTFENANSVLCVDCREQFIRYPIPKWLYAVFALVAAFLLIALIKVPKVITDFKTYKNAEFAYNQRNFNTSANAYLQIGDNYKTALRINERTFLSLMKAQRFEEASKILDERLAGESGSEETVDEINNYIDLMDRYIITLNKIDTIYSNKSLEKDQIKLYAEIESLLKDKQYDVSIIYFSLAQINVAQNKENQAIKQLQDAFKTEPRYTYITSYLGNIQRRFSHYSDAIDSYNNALSYNRDDESAYRGLSVVNMLMGDNKKGLENAKKAYDLNKNGYYVTKTYIVALHLNGNKAEAMSINNAYKKSPDYLLDQELEDYLSGKITLEKIYIN